MCPEPMVGILDGVGAVACYIGVIHGVSAQQIVHGADCPGEICVIFRHIVSVGQQDGVVRYKGIGTPDIAGILVCVGNGALPIGLPIALVCRQLCEIIPCGGQIALELICVSPQLIGVQGQGQRTQSCGMSPVKAAHRIHGFAAAQCCGQRQIVLGSLHVVQIAAVPGGYKQLTGCPVEFIRCVVVPVCAAALGFIQRCVHFGMCLGCGVCRLGSIQTLLCKCGIKLLPQPVRLRAACCHVQGCCCRGRLDDTLLRILRRCHCQSCPLGVMHLVVRHACIVSALNDHLHEPFHFIPGFIQQIRIAVGVLRNGHGSVCVYRNIPLLEGMLILVLHQPQGNAAVHHIFSVVAGIIPAAGNVLGAAAAAVAPGLLDGGSIRVMTCRPGKTGAVPGNDVLALDLDAAAVLIEIVQRIVQHIGVQSPVADLELPALGAGGSFQIIRSGGGVFAEIQLMHIVPGIRIQALGGGGAGVHGAAAGILQIELHTAAVTGKQGCLLAHVLKVAQLVG